MRFIVDEVGTTEIRRDTHKRRVQRKIHQELFVGGNMAINSKRKGKVGELELAKVLREYGYDCRRTNQYCGNTGEASDVVGLPYIHIECKRVERLNLDDAIKQAERDAKSDELPTVFHRKNHHKWLVTMTLDDWMALYKGEF